MLLLIIVPCVLCFVYAWIRRKKLLEGKLPPIAGGAWPFIGHFHIWIRGLFWNRFLWIQEDCLEQGCVTYLYAGTNPAYSFYALCDPEDCNTVANACPEKAYMLDDSITAMFGEGLATAPVSIWKNHRILLDPIFEQLCRRTDVVNQYTQILLDEFKAKSGSGPFDPTDYLRRTAIRIFFSIIYGIDDVKNGCLRRDVRLETYQVAMQQASRILFQRYQSYFMHKKLFFNRSRLKRRQDGCINVIKDISNKIITMRKTELNTKTVADNDIHNEANQPSCLLDALLSLEAQGFYTEQQVTDELNTTMFYGYETVVNSLTFILVMLKCHPEVQEKVYLEVGNVLGVDKQYNLVTEDLSKLLYLEAVIMETLRLYPTVTSVSRINTSALNIKTYPIDPGSQCLLLISAMNRHPTWGKDRNVFKPERWLEQTPSTNHSFRSIDQCGTFGMGKRSCIGRELALAVMKIILVHILCKYKILPNETVLKVKQNLLLTPESGHRITLEKRTQKNEEV